jgi:UDP-2-acetamido-3-amino-2,3-dideoxy-glucuronate N-acetyltransferase
MEEEKRCFISPQAQIGQNVSFGYNVIIEQDVVIGSNVEIGHNVIIHSGVCVGEFLQNTG